MEKKKVVNKGVILLGMSSPDVRNTVKGLFLELDTIDIVGAGDGMKVLNILRDYGRKRKIFLILDWDLPKISGLEIAREIRGDRKLENLPILLLTSEISPKLVGLASEVGVNGLVVKPFVIASLLDKFAGIIRDRDNPPEHVKLIKRGEMMIVRGKYDKALELFSESQKMKKSARILVHIGEAFEMMEKYVKAQGSYDDAVTANPHYLKAYVTASNLLMKLDDEGAALPYLEKAVVISPYNPDRQTLLGSIYLKNGDDQNAEKAFAEAVRQDKTKSSEIGEHYLQAGDTKKAEKYFRGYLAADSSVILPENQLHVYNRLGITLRKQGEWNKAIEEYKKALKINGNDPGLLYNMGKAWVEGKNLIEARNWLKKAIEIEPSFPEALEELKKIGKI